jgi:hypothetical protein
MSPENPLNNGQPSQPQPTPIPTAAAQLQPQYQQPSQPGPSSDIPVPQPAQAYMPNYDDPSAQSAAPPVQHFDTSQQVRASLAPESYDFIVNPEKSRKAVIALPNSLRQRIIIVVAVVIVLVIAIPVVASLLKPKDTTLPALLAVADQQQELIHLSDPNSTNNTQHLSSDTTNTISTINQTVTSSQQLLLSYLSKNAVKLKPGQIVASNEVPVDAALNTAASGGNYEAILLSSLQTQLTRYGTSLKAAYALEKGPKGKALLTSDYNQQQLLVTSLNITNNNPVSQ